MKIVNEKETQKTTKTNKDRKEPGGTEAMMNGWELHGFAVHLN